MTELELETPHGAARAHLHPSRCRVPRSCSATARAGASAARDLVAATQAARRGRRSASRWSSSPTGSPGAARRRRRSSSTRRGRRCVAQLREGELRGLPLVAGGRSSGARVACRTAAATGAAGVLCLAFPLHPPGRPEIDPPAELDAVAVPVLVVQGASDPFGMPAGGAGREIVVVPGNHGLKGDLEALAERGAGLAERRCGMRGTRAANVAVTLDGAY